MIRTTCFLAVFSVLLFSSALMATEGNLSYVKDKTLSLAPAVVVNAMAFSPDGKLLAVSGEKPEGNYKCTPLPVQVWDVATGQRIRVLEGSASFVPFLEFSPDGSVLARVLHSNFRGPTLVLYDTETWEIKTQFSSVPRKTGGESEFPDPWDFPKFLPDGNLLVQADLNVLGVINAEGQVQREYNFVAELENRWARVHIGNVSPDLQRIFIKENKTIQKEFTEIYITEFTVYDLDTMNQTHTLQVEDKIRSEPFFFDKKTIAFAVKDNNCITPRFWNLDNGTFAMANSCLTPFSYGLSIHPKNKEVAAAFWNVDEDTGVKILDRKTLTVRDRFEVDGIAQQARFAPTGDVLAVSTGIQPFHCGKLDAPSATVELWNVHDEGIMAQPQAWLVPDPSEVAFYADDPAWKTFAVRTSLDSVLVRANPSGSDPAVEVAGGSDAPIRGYCPAEGNDSPSRGRRDGWSLHVKACQVGQTEILLIDYDTGEVLQQYEVNVDPTQTRLTGAQSQAWLVPDPSEVAFYADDPAWKTFTVRTSLDSVLVRANPSGSDPAIEVAGGQDAPTQGYCPAEGNDSPSRGRRDGWSLHVKACQVGQTKLLLIDYDTGEVLQQYGVNVEASTSASASTRLNPSYPNPFNSETVLSYTLPIAADIRLEVFTLNGQRVAVLHEGFQAAGYHTASMDASGLASGVYLYRLTTPEGRFAQKFTLLR